MTRSVAVGHLLKDLKNKIASSYGEKAIIKIEALVVNVRYPGEDPKGENHVLKVKEMN